VLIGLAFVAGIADSVFHPADYTILTGKIRQSWLGRAYAIHTFSGFLGFAVAPTVMTFLLVYGTWRDALAVIGIAGLVTAGALLASGRLLSGVTYVQKRAPGQAGQTGALTLLMSPPLLIMFLFYVFTSFSSSGLQNFGNSALISLYQLDIVGANTALAAFLWGSAIGVLAGGLLADHMKRFDAVVTVCYLLAAAALCLIGFAALPYVGMTAALFFSGFVLGVVMPARDMMVRAITPPGAVGKTFGYVSSGFGVGGVVGPLVFGAVMDFDLPQLLFFVSACAMLAVIAIALVASYVAKRAGALGLHGV
jgi:FSR family fosmidomycin resistance protein-like MFS transporter